jgi:hypothetical protein
MPEPARHSDVVADLKALRPRHGQRLGDCTSRAACAVEGGAG